QIKHYRDDVVFRAYSPLMDQEGRYPEGALVYEQRLPILAPVTCQAAPYTVGSAYVTGSYTEGNVGLVQQVSLDVNGYAYGAVPVLPGGTFRYYGKDKIQHVDDYVLLRFYTHKHAVCGEQIVDVRGASKA
ncbi:immunoglobulin-like domain-containing protein, partial [Listeria rocourtiae]|uniref:immunoglobulin-like domain-containing protein n=1 Tax=Listeria rocourtiae TaxID=647910 RepID=UPI0003E86CFC